MGYLHAVDSTNSLTASDDRWATARDGEVWWWDGEQLVPTSPDEAAFLREIDARRRLRNWEGSAKTMPARSRARHRTKRQVGWFATVSRLLSARPRQRQAPTPAAEDVVQAHR